MIRAFVFDWDDTLVQTRQCRFAAIKELARRFYLHSLDDSVIEQHWGKPFHSLFGDLFAEHDTDIERVIGRYLLLTSEFPMVSFPNAVATLESLTQHFSVGIVTSASSRVVLPDLARLGFPVEGLVAVQCAEETACHKPNPRVFDPILSKLDVRGIDKGEIVYVGDCVNDFIAASNAGLRFVGISRDSQTQRSFEESGCATVEDLYQLIGYNDQEVPTGPPRHT